MSEEIGHNCGLCVTHSLNDVYDFIKSLQHRGREATGIAAIGDRIDAIKWEGPVNKFDLVDLYKIFPSPHYHTYFGHVRYATRGRKDRILEDAHPHVIGGEMEHRGNHIIIRNCDVAGVHNGQVNDDYFKEIDINGLRTGCDTEALLYFYYQKGEYELMKKIPGAYTIAIADRRRKDIIILRDRTGIKPGALGLKDGKHSVASEDVAFSDNGGEIIEDLDPGYVYYLDSDGGYKKEKIAEATVKPCFFEWNYIGRQDATLDGVSVRRLRELLGEIAAEEFHPDDIDYVTFLPRCPEVAARAYAKKTGLPFVYVFYKMRGERAFQGSTADDRAASIIENLHLRDEIDEIPIKEFLEGKTLLCMDDSMIRGNNSRRERYLLYEEAGVKKAYHFNYTPPIGRIGKDGKKRGCKYGVDMPPDDNFIARGRTNEQISEIMKMPVRYLSLDGMLRAYKKLGIEENNLCTFCIGGPDPLKGL